ncbi:MULTISPECIES: LysR family transcriptional regulator [unclassified Serratia (in: enterobacteria)]|uniref:LysR family transcriptional regulator n=1 Tax=unclassified Serratia (in: enterobacteria) TaxID=2647522 RepID=UPI00050592C7|nr:MULTISPECIES: LysR family transcriptional regulator [unclassified Serratia (in: enterobacteria)]KFK93149.1 LysR family transcriptional regulator [Serratia sp. Ag2]KFK99588.1 LysR family transcriptional regulator [Serratia sp. Ag1]
MNTRLLKTFLVVAQTQNVTRAAEVVHLAQSSVSDQLQVLEAELGFELFSRTRQGLRLTPAGEALKSYAEDILALVSEAQSAVALAADRREQSLTLGALETIGSLWLPVPLADLQRQQPDLGLQMKITGSGQLLQGVADGTLDAAFCFDKGELDERLNKRVISSEPLVFIGAPESAKASLTISLESIPALRFITTEQGCIYRHLFTQVFATAKLPPPVIAAEVGSITAIGRLVAAGAGYALVPRIAVAEMLEAGKVVELPWPGQIGTAPLVLIWRRRRVQSPALKRLLAAAEQWASIR